jgi:phosphoribosylanthranilate isomerase
MIHSRARAILLDAHVEGYGGGGKGIQLVTPSTKRQLSPRFVWWTHACKRDRWHFASAAARHSLAVDVSSGVELDGPDGQPIKGIKDARKIHQFVAAVRAADEQLAGTSHVPVPPT